jgi:membrane fusion protein, multidrug efflux system
VIHVPEGRLEALRKARSLAVRLWAVPGKQYQARLREVNLQADRSTRTHEARVSIPDSDEKVQLGMSATVMMGAQLDSQLFSVPLSALDARQDQAVVWTVDGDSQLRSVPVQVMRYVEGAAIVAGELTPQTSIVSAGVHLMVEGQKVGTLPRQRTGATATVGHLP